MAEGCPARAALESFAAGNTAEAGRAEVEAHLGHCLSCAEELEKLTRAQLDLLVGHRASAAALRPATSPVLDTLMRRAAEGTGGSPRLDEERVLAILDPPMVKGALGTFAGYDILEIAGRGGMGVVLKAHDRTLDRVVAIKVIFPTGTSDDSFAARFLEEARAVAAIHHDHIVTVHHAGMAKGLAYLVMPFHAEGTLEQLLASSPKLAAMDVARIGLQLARALAAMHGRKILHRDIKPSNVLLEQGLKRVRLADFGLAQTRDVTTEQFASGGSRRTEAQTRKEGSGSSHSPLAPAVTNPGKHTVAGTPHYMSPEQARGEALDARSDLFGLGAVLFQMATGQTLYAGDSSKEVLQAATRCQLKPVREIAPEVPAALATIIDRLLAKRAEDRPASAQEVAGDLDAFINRERRWRRLLQRAAGITFAACLALSAAIVALDWSGQTAIINARLCERRGDGYFIRGRFGTFARLPEAVAAARPHDVIEARFSDERLVGAFRVGGKPLTIRAAPGFTPMLLATNSAQPMILADAPLTLEGLTIWRRGLVVNFTPLLSVEDAPLHLLNCRLIRSRFHSQYVMGQGRLIAPPGADSQRFRALIGFQHGSTGRLRNCVFVGTRATAIGFRASMKRPVRVEVEHSLFFIDRGFNFNPEAESGITLVSRRAVFAISTLLDLNQAEIREGICATWQDCLVDRAQGAVVRLQDFGDGARLRALEWKETNVTHAGPGAYLADRHSRQIESMAEWKQLMRLPPDNHRLTDRQAFPETCVRSGLTLKATDLDAETLRAANLDPARFDPSAIGEGEAYEKFQRSPDYREWRKRVRIVEMDWEQRRAAKP